MISYRPVFGIDVRHEFFADGRCRNLRFEASAETAALMANRGLLLRRTASGIAVFGEAGEPVVAPAGPTKATKARTKAKAGSPQDSGEVISLRFRVLAGDQDFDAYTDPGARPDGTVLAFDSVSATEAPPGSGFFRLHRDEWVGAGDGIDRRNWVSTLLDPGDRTSLTLAAITVRLTEQDLAAGGSGRRYFLAFRSRRTHWKYYVTGMKAKNAVASISDTAGVVQFTDAGLERLSSDREALTLRSIATIPLQERPIQRFQLRLKPTVGEAVVVKRLAVASPRRLGKETIDGRTVTVSEIYINL